MRFIIRRPSDSPGHGRLAVGAIIVKESVAPAMSRLRAWRKTASGKTTAITRQTPSPVCCGSDPRPRSRAAPVRLLRLRLIKRTGAIGAIPWQVYPGDRNLFHSWGQVSRQAPTGSPLA